MANLVDLFLLGIQTRGAFFDAYITATLIMLACCLVLIYLTVMALLASPLYRGDRVRPFIDSDIRIKLASAWVVWLVMVLLVGSVGWIYWKAVLPVQTDTWLYLRPLAAHLTVLLLLFVFWLAFYVSVRDDSKSAQRTLS